MNTNVPRALETPEDYRTEFTDCLEKGDFGKARKLFDEALKKDMLWPRDETFLPAFEKCIEKILIRNSTEVHTMPTVEFAYLMLDCRLKPKDLNLPQIFENVMMSFLSGHCIYPDRFIRIAEEAKRRDIEIDIKDVFKKAAHKLLTRPMFFGSGPSFFTIENLVDFANTKFSISAEKFKDVLQETLEYWCKISESSYEDYFRHIYLILDFAKERKIELDVQSAFDKGLMHHKERGDQESLKDLKDVANHIFKRYRIRVEV